MGDPSSAKDRAAPGVRAGPAQPQAPCPLVLCCAVESWGLEKGCLLGGPELVQAWCAGGAGPEVVGRWAQGPPCRLRGLGLLGKT